MGTITERFAFAAKRDPKTGVTVREEWKDKNGKKHRTDGPAVIVRDTVTGIITLEEWYRHGLRHREVNAALTRYDAGTGKLALREWYENGELRTQTQYRDGFFDCLYDYRNGERVAKVWWRDGKVLESERLEVQERVRPSRRRGHASGLSGPGELRP